MVINKTGIVMKPSKIRYSNEGSSNSEGNRCPYCGKVMNHIKRSNVMVCINPACQGTQQPYYELK